MAYKKIKPKNDFRYNRRTKHMHYVFGEYQGKYLSINPTHARRTFGKKNMRLRDNPQRGHSETAYIANGFTYDKKSNYSKKKNNWRWSKRDKPNVKSKTRHYRHQHKWFKK